LFLIDPRLDERAEIAQPAAEIADVSLPAVRPFGGAREPEIDPRAVRRGLAVGDGAQRSGASFAPGVPEPPVVELDPDLRQGEAVLGDRDRDLGGVPERLLGAGLPEALEGGGVLIDRGAQ